MQPDKILWQSCYNIEDYEITFTGYRNTILVEMDTESLVVEENFIDLDSARAWLLDYAGNTPFKCVTDFDFIRNTPVDS